MAQQTLADMLGTPETLIMGILNVTPDSFSGDGVLNFSNPTAAAIDQVDKMVKAGAKIIDIGAESTRPGAQMLSHESEAERILPIVEAVRSRFDISISIDTRKSRIAHDSLVRGACIINDVSGLDDDPDMIQTIIKHNAYIVLMSHTGVSACNVEKSSDLGSRFIATKTASSNFVNSQVPPIVTHVFEDLKNKVDACIAAGHDRGKIIVDIGIGFNKTVEENLQLLAHLSYFDSLGLPMLLGASRKSVIGYISQAPAHQRLGGSIAIVALAAMNNVKMVRVHDVHESVQAAQFIAAVQKFKQV